MSVKRVEVAESSERKLRSQKDKTKKKPWNFIFCLNRQYYSNFYKVSPINFAWPILDSPWFDSNVPIIFVPAPVLIKKPGPSLFMLLSHAS